MCARVVPVPVPVPVPALLVHPVEDKAHYGRAHLRELLRAAPQGDAPGLTWGYHQQRRVHLLRQHHRVGDRK